MKLQRMRTFTITTNGAFTAEGFNHPGLQPFSVRINCFRILRHNLVPLGGLAPPSVRLKVGDSSFELQWRIQFLVRLTGFEPALYWF